MCEIELVYWGLLVLGSWLVVVDVLVMFRFGISE